MYREGPEDDDPRQGEIARLNAQVAELTAKLDAVREAIRHGGRMDMHPTIGGVIRSLNDAVGWGEYLKMLDDGWRRNMLAALEDG